MSAVLVNAHISAAAFNCVYCKQLLKSPVKYLICGHRICQLCITEIVEHGKGNRCPGNDECCGKTDVTNKTHVFSDKATDNDLKKINSAIQKTENKECDFSIMTEADDKQQRQEVNERQWQSARAQDRPKISTCQWRSAPDTPDVNTYQRQSAHVPTYAWTSEGMWVYLPNVHPQQTNMMVCPGDKPSYDKTLKDKKVHGFQKYFNTEKIQGNSNGCFEKNSDKEGPSACEGCPTPSCVAPAPLTGGCTCRYVGQLEGENSVLRWQCHVMQTTMDDVLRKFDSLLQRQSNSQ